MTGKKPGSAMRARFIIPQVATSATPLPWVKWPGGSDVHGKQFVIYGVCRSCKEAGFGEGEE